MTAVSVHMPLHHQVKGRTQRERGGHWNKWTAQLHPKSEYKVDGMNTQGGTQGEHRVGEVVERTLGWGG